MGRIKAKGRAIVDFFTENFTAQLAFIVIPVFAFIVWFGIDAVMGGSEVKSDIKASLVNAGVFSLRVLAAIFFVHAVAHKKRWAWDLDNGYRAELQNLLIGRTKDGEAYDYSLSNRFGAFLVLAGESLVKLIMLWFFLRALILWPQGIA